MIYAPVRASCWLQIDEPPHRPSSGQWIVLNVSGLPVSEPLDCPGGSCGVPAVEFRTYRGRSGHPAALSEDLRKMKGMWRPLGAAAAALVVTGAAAREVAYLGVATEPISPIVGRHLGFGEGVGIEVVYIDREGAVHGVLQEGDILIRFNDQLLVNHEQLAVLVRRQKPGDKVTLSYYREGQTRSAEVRLRGIDDQRVGSISPHRRPIPSPEAFGWSPPALERWLEEFSARAWRPFGRRWMSPNEEDDDASPAPRADIRIQTHSSAVISESKDGLNITVSVQDGRRSARITKEGQVVFEGPVNDDAEIGRIPEEYRDRVSEMLKRVRVEVRGAAPSEPSGKKSRGGAGLRPGNVL